MRATAFPFAAVHPNLIHGDDELKKKQMLGNFFLLMTALIWGMAFVAQRVGMDYVGPLTFGAARFWLAAAVLFPASRLLSRSDGKKPALPEAEQLRQKKLLQKAGLLCGTLLFFASAIQQVGLIYTTAGKASFITALYIVLVPVIGIFLRQRTGLQAWIGVALATFGLYLLTVTESFTIAGGDLIVLVSALFWGLHVLAIGHFSPSLNAVKLAMTQFVVCAALSTVGALIVEEPTWPAIVSGAIPILYAGILSGGVAYTFQILGQRHTSPTIASLLLSMEAVFGALFGYLLLEEIMSGRELLGCALMFVAIVISQLPSRSAPRPDPVELPLEKAALDETAIKE